MKCIKEKRSALDDRDKFFPESFKEFYDTRTNGVDSEVLADTGTIVAVKFRSNLTDDNLANVDSLTARKLDSPSLTGTVAFLIGFSLRFSMSHSKIL